MPSFFEDYSDFYGTNETNDQGLDLKQFLEQYQPGDYENPSVTTDVIVFKHNGALEQVEKNLKVLMVKRKNHPCIGYWALPGGFVNMNEDVSDAAKRELEEETHLRNIPMEQLAAWGEVKRDPRYRIITVAYLALVDETVSQIQADDDAADAGWMNVEIELTKEEELVGTGFHKLRSVYKIHIYQEEKQVDLTAYIEKLENKNAIIKETVYTVIENNGIAFDHGRFLVQALLYLKERIKIK